MKRSPTLGFPLWVWLALCPPLCADVKLPALFSDHAVLQRAASVPVWGWAAPGERVTVEFGDVTAQTDADAAGRWRVTLDLRTKARDGAPASLVVSGLNRLEVRDVVVGEVWLCSGQSNMEWQLGGSEGGAAAVAEAGRVPVRQFYVEKRSALAPLDDCAGRWIVASPETAAQFTAVGYYFARALQPHVGGPVGIVHSSWAGTEIERWLSEEAFDRDPELKAAKDERLGHARSFGAKFAAYLDAYRAWTRREDREDRPRSLAEFAARPDIKQGWRTVQLPGPLAGAGLPDAGVIWLRRVLALPPGLVGTWGIPLELGRIDGAVTVYWNGEKIGGTTLETPGAAGVQRFWIPGEKITGRTADLMLRLVCPAGGAGFRAEKGAFRAESIDLAGEWEAKAERAWPDLPAEARAAFPRQPELPPGGLEAAPSALFDAMIAPLVPYAIRGAVWYQGESNVDRAVQYRTALTLLIDDWRRRWGRGDFPFLLCQLANFQEKSAEPGESEWAELREAQAGALTLPGTALAVLIDLGEQGDIHPRNKGDVGARLALLARARAYGESVAGTGPRYRSMSVEGGRIRIQFTDTAGGLRAKPLPDCYRIRSTQPDLAPLARHNPDGPLEGFAICGADRRWRWARARIEGDTVVVSSPDVPEPKAVRYAWASNPTCNLSDGTGLPAAPFRTDDFPLTTERGRY